MRARLGTMAILIGLGLTTIGVTGAKAQEGPPPPGYYNQPWTQPPGEYRDDISQRGFHDGIEGARRDFQNHRPPNVNNRDEYRHPSVSGRERHAYRDAFRRGYQMGVQRIYNGRRY
jgi:ribosome modulation factor